MVCRFFPLAAYRVRRPLYAALVLPPAPWRGRAPRRPPTGASAPGATVPGHADHAGEPRTGERASVTTEREIIQNRNVFCMYHAASYKRLILYSFAVRRQRKGRRCAASANKARTDTADQRRDPRKRPPPAGPHGGKCARRDCAGPRRPRGEPRTAQSYDGRAGFLEMYSITAAVKTRFGHVLF